VAGVLAKRAFGDAAWPVLPGGWRPVPLRAGLMAAGELLAPLGGAGPGFASGEDLVHGRGAGGQRGPDLVPVDGLSDRGAAMAHQVADVLNTDAMGAENGQKRVP